MRVDLVLGSMGNKGPDCTQGTGDGCVQAGVCVHARHCHVHEDPSDEQGLVCDPLAWSARGQRSPPLIQIDFESHDHGNRVPLIHFPLTPGCVTHDYSSHDCVNHDCANHDYANHDYASRDFLNYDCLTPGSHLTQAAFHRQMVGESHWVWQLIQSIRFHAGKTRPNQPHHMLEVHLQTRYLISIPPLKARRKQGVLYICRGLLP